MSSRRRSLGLSLIEVVVFIIVLGVGFAGILILYNQTTLASVDPVVRKQAVAIATSLMEEIQLRGFTYCDPDDPDVYTSSGACGTLAEGMGPEAGETRYSATTPFDNVNDYNGFGMAAGNIRDVTGTLISGLGAYTVNNIAISQISAGELGADVPAAEALRIEVTVTGPAGVTVSLQGYRIRYAPNTP